MENRPQRKPMRLERGNYSATGAYFLTVCTKDRRCLLSHVGTVNGIVAPITQKQNSAVSRYISTLKRFCNKEYGENIWQARSHDHIIRSRQDYDDHLRYIRENPLRWHYDELYCEKRGCPFFGGNLIFYTIQRFTKCPKASPGSPPPSPARTHPIPPWRGRFPALQPRQLPGGKNPK